MVTPVMGFVQRTFVGLVTAMAVSEKHRHRPKVFLYKISRVSKKEFNQSQNGQKYVYGFIKNEF